jgi:hypothetical protein
LRTFSAALVVAGVLGLSSSALLAQNAPVLEFTGVGNNGVSVTLQSEGWQFTVNSPVTVVALDGLVASGATSVRLYDSSTQLASATITTGNPTEGSPFAFYTQSIAPVQLTPGTYYIAEDMIVGTPVDLNVTGLTVNPAITYDASVDGLGLGTDPTSDINGPGEAPGNFGPNFDIAPAGVPEPGTAALALAALVFGSGAAFSRRRARR